MVWENLDIFKEAGGGYTALVKETQVTVADSFFDDSLLTFEFESVAENPKLSALGILPTTRTCNATRVDFDTKADGTPLTPGLYVENEWLDFGLVVSASGGLKGLPRLFDTANPRSEEGCGDSDLGASNRACTPSGPGIGAGGATGEPGENCIELGNVLIIQDENDNHCPDDSRKGGTIMFVFIEPAKAVYEMGVLDTDDSIAVEVSHMTDVDGTVATVFDLTI